MKTLKPIKPHRHRLITLPPAEVQATGNVFRCLGCKAKMKTAEGGVLLTQCFVPQKEAPWPFRRR